MEYGKKHKLKRLRLSCTCLYYSLRGWDLRILNESQKTKNPKTRCT